MTASLIFRLPELANASAINSDASIVGLQAMRMLRGEWSPSLYGSSYQTSADATTAAAVFGVIGPSSLALMLSALIGHLLLTSIVYAMLARWLGRARAAVLSLPLVFTTCVVHTYALHPPRQMALTLAFVSAWILAADHRIASLRMRFGLGAFVAGIAVFADPYALVFLGPLALYASTWIAADGPSLRRRATLVGTYGAGLVLGLLPVILLWAAHRGPPSVVIASHQGAAARCSLFARTCLPIALGFQIPTLKAPLQVGPPALHVACGLVISAAALFACASPFVKRVTTPIRRLALLATSTCIVTSIGFVLSRCAVDQESHRYLVGMSLMLPFLFAPVACVLDTKRLVALLLPVIASFSIAGWAAYGPRVRGLKITHYAETLDRDRTGVRELLHQRGIDRAVTNYWDAYTMTFLFRDEILVVPREPWLDRIPTDRARVLDSDKIAYIVDRTAAWDSTALTDFWLKPLGMPYDRVDVGRYTVVLLDRSRLRSLPQLSAARTRTTSEARF